MTGHLRIVLATTSIVALWPKNLALAEDFEILDGFLGPAAYLAFDDPFAGEAISPFAGIRFEYFHLEDFEDGALNVPGVFIEEMANGTPLPLGTRLTLGSDRAVDSVDNDDGLIDGEGDAVSLWANRATNSFTFHFVEDVLGQLPTHAGIVWTDVGMDGNGLPTVRDLTDNVIFQAYGADGQSLGLIGPFSVGDETIFGTTAEDRFFGIVHGDGISRIRLSMPMNKNWEADHLQFGLVVPEASTFMLVLACATAIAAALAPGAIKRRRCAAG